MPALSAKQQQLVAAHIGIAIAVAKRKWPAFRRWMSFDDAVGSAYLGLCKSALTYDGRKTVKFSGYAWQGCAQQIRDDAKDYWLLIHVPRHMLNKKKEKSKIYKKRKNAANAAQNRFCAKQAINLQVCSRALDEVEIKAAVEPHRSTVWPAWAVAMLLPDAP